ncbi:MAG TPA: hypothetical protein PKA83_15735 [Pirellulaceae bacterium]|nr:hypothetical protein [Pirellulaceae bacterium]
MLHQSLTHQASKQQPQTNCFLICLTVIATVLVLPSLANEPGEPNELSFATHDARLVQPSSQIPPKFNSVVAVNNHTVEIEFQHDGCPTECSPNWEPYIAITRVTGNGCSDNLLKEFLKPELCLPGTHTVTVDLRHIEGTYEMFVVMDDPSLECFGTFAESFSFHLNANGDPVVDFTPPDPITIGSFEPGAEAVPTTPLAAFCGFELIDVLDGTTLAGDSAACSPYLSVVPGEVLWTLSGASGGCNDCVGGSAGSFSPLGLGSMPIIPVEFRMLNHLAPYRSSPGAGSLSSLRHVGSCRAGRLHRVSDRAVCRRSRWPSHPFLRRASRLSGRRGGRRAARPLGPVQAGGHQRQRSRHRTPQWRDDEI